jgi:hypothetical protein
MTGGKYRLKGKTAPNTSARLLGGRLVVAVDGWDFYSLETRRLCTTHVDPCPSIFSTSVICVKEYLQPHPVVHHKKTTATEAAVF